ncbi:MAG: hypothetical protein PHZ00_01590 [Candidatus Peribacteraceae bacterium]|nr:hypothetical protein [Candidatus Peribacteraceae bacterium]
MTPPADDTAAHKRAFLTQLGVQIPSGKEVYDSIMGNIEPELVTENLTTLDEPYADESAEDRKARYQRYTEAFAEYRKQFTQWAGNLRQAVKTFRRSVVTASETKSRADDEIAIAALEAQM